MTFSWTDAMVLRLRSNSFGRAVVRSCCPERIVVVYGRGRLVRVKGVLAKMCAFLVGHNVMDSLPVTSQRKAGQ